MSGRGQKGSLLSLSNLFELTEASAYRITPDYVYAFRKSKVGKGIVPVHIKHANVKKYWDDLADPPPGSPLANTVIGQIPRYYKAATDLKLKDPTKKLSDLMSKDGDAPKAVSKPPRQAEVPMMAAPAMDPAEADAALVANKLGYKLKSKKAKAVAALLKHGNHVDAAVELAGGEDDTEALEKALDYVMGVISDAESAGLVDSKEGEGDEEGVYFVTVKPAAVSPVVQPKPAPAPPPPAPPVPVAVPLPPAPAPAPKPTPAALDVSTMSVDEPPPAPKGKSYADEFEKIWQAKGIEKGKEALKKLPFEVQANFVKGGKLSHMGLTMLGAVVQGQPPEVSAKAVMHALMANYAMQEPEAKAKADHFMAWAAIKNIPLGMAPAIPPAPAPAPAPPPEPAKSKLPLTMAYKSLSAAHKNDLGGMFSSLVNGASAAPDVYPKFKQTLAELGITATFSDEAVPAQHLTGALFKTLESKFVTEPEDKVLQYGTLNLASIFGSSMSGPFILAAQKTGLDKALLKAARFKRLASYSQTVDDFLEKSNEGELKKVRKAIEDTLGTPLEVGGVANKVTASVVAGLWFGSADTYETLTTLKGDFGQPAEDIFKKLVTAGILKVSSEGPPYESEMEVPAPAAPPVSEPEKSKVPVSDGWVGGLSVPPLASLKDAGDAKASLGGLHAKRFLKDGEGKKYLFKPSTTAQAAAGQVYADLAGMVLGKKKVIPVVHGDVPGLGYGSVQPMLTNVVSDLKGLDPTTFTKSQLEDLMGEKVMDWALSSHDAKAGNFLKLADGTFIGVDKEQAFKHVGEDQLSTTYNPNPSPQLANAVFELFKQKTIDLPLGAIGDTIEKVESIPDDVWMAKVQSYLDKLPPNVAAQKKAAILARKQAVRTDFEKFLTGVLRERGTLGPKDIFKFPKTGPEAAPEEPPKKKKKKDTGDTISGVIPPMGSVLSPPAVPPMSALSYAGPATGIGGAGEKHFYTDANGNKWLLKVAKSKDKTKNEPHRAAVQEIFSQVSSIVRPGKSVPVASVPEGFNGGPATIQPWLPLGNPPTLKGTLPPNLKDSEKKDVAEEHLLDYLLSQHDTHAANLVRKADGTIVSIDKEQGFKYFMGFPGAPEDTGLSVDYHPNKLYGEDEPYYNKFWRSFGNGGLDFDPTVMQDAVARVESIKDGDYVQLLSKYVQYAKFKDDPKEIAKFLEKAVARKKNIRADFEKFISDLYEKRTKKKGAFSFAGGWAEAGVPAAATAPKKAPAKKKAAAPAEPVPVPAEPKPVKKPTELLGQLQTPLSTGALGMESPELVKAGVLPAVQPPPPPPVPAGYPAPPAGKMWKVEPASKFFATGGGVVYKVKPVKDLATGNVDPNSPNQLVKLVLTEEAAKDALSKAGITPVAPLKTKEGKVYAIVNKDEWNKLLASSKQIGVLVDLPPPPPPPSGKFQTIPKPGALKNPEATQTFSSLSGVLQDKTIGYGKNFVVDGPAVENQSVRVVRKVDANDKVFYEVNFKLRAPYLSKATGGKPDTLSFDRYSYEAGNDGWKRTGGAQNSAESISGVSKWQDAKTGCSLYVGQSGVSRYAFRGTVVARVYPQAGEDLTKALTRVVSMASPTLAQKVMKEPTEEDTKLQKLSALYWAKAPQESDSLPESERTVAKLTEKLKALGITEDEINSVRQEEVALGTSVPVLPGRHKKIQQSQNISHISVDVSSPERVVKQLRSGSIGVNERVMQGLPVPETDTSPTSDQNTGGADYVFANAVRKDGGKFYRWGQISMVYDPSEMDRLDCFVHPGDYYGCTDPSQKSGAFKNRSTVEAGANTCAEICFKRGINARKLMKIACASASTAATLIQQMKTAGITQVNGMTPEELVAHVPNGASFYSTYLQPAGY